MDSLISNFDLKICVAKNLRIITKSNAVDQEKEFPTKSVLQPFGLTSPFRQRGSESKTIVVVKIIYSVVIQERDLKISLSVLSVVIFLISDMISCLALLSHAKNFHFPIQLHVRTPWNLKKNLNSFVIVNIYLKICKNVISNWNSRYLELSYTVYNI